MIYKLFGIKFGILLSLLFLTGAALSGRSGLEKLDSWHKVPVTLQFMITGKNGKWVHSTYYKDANRVLMASYKFNDKSYQKIISGEYLNERSKVQLLVNPENPNIFYLLHPPRMFGMDALFTKQALYLLLAGVFTFVFYMLIAIIRKLFAVTAAVAKPLGKVRATADLHKEDGGFWQLIKGRRHEYGAITGTVLEQGDKAYTETHIHSSGGGGFVTNGYGYFNAPQISSSTTTHREFWIRLEDGNVMPVKLQNADVSVLPGHKVSILLVEDNSGAQTWVSILNHTTNMYTRLDGNVGALVAPGTLLFIGLPTLLAAVVTGMTIKEGLAQALTYAGLAWVPMLAIFYVLLVLPVTLRRSSRLTRNVDAVAQSALSFIPSQTEGTPENNVSGELEAQAEA